MTSLPERIIEQEEYLDALRALQGLTRVPLLQYNAQDYNIVRGPDHVNHTTVTFGVYFNGELCAAFPTGALADEYLHFRKAHESK